MLNKVIIAGRLGQEPKTNQNKTASNFSVALNRYTKSATGEKVEETTWFNVVAYKGQAGFANDYLQKGDLVAVEGSLRERSYTDKDGHERKVVEIVASNLSILSRAGGTEAAAA